MIDQRRMTLRVREVRRHLEKRGVLSSDGPGRGHFREHRGPVGGDRIPETGVFGQQLARLVQIRERSGPEHDVALPKARNNLVRPPCRGLVAARIVEAANL